MDRAEVSMYIEQFFTHNIPDLFLLEMRVTDKINPGSL